MRVKASWEAAGQPAGSRPSLPSGGSLLSPLDSQPLTSDCRRRARHGGYSRARLGKRTGMNASSSHRSPSSRARRAASASSSPSSSPSNGFDLDHHRRGRRIATPPPSSSAGARVEAVRADLATPTASRSSTAASRRGRPVDAAALNAGVGAGGAFADDTDLERRARVIDLNVALHRAPGQAVVRDMVAPRRGPDPVHVVDRVDDARRLPGRLQRVEVVRAVLRDGAAQRAEGHRRHRHLADARPDRDRVLRARRHARHQGRRGRQGRPRRRRPRRASRR